MSTPEEPARLVLESSGASAELRRALGAARGDLPSPDHVEAMLARFPFPDGGGGGGDTGGDGVGSDTGGAPDVGGGADIAAGAAKSAALGKWIGLAFLAASAGTVFYAKTTTPPHAAEPTPSAVVVATASAATTPTVTAVPSPEPSTVESSAIESSTPTASATAPHSQPSATTSATASASASSEPVRPEIEILKEAQGSRSNPARMLELVNEHARSHPKAVLGQEREMLRIEALLGLGKRAEAKALADAIRKGNPNSVYAERLNQLIPP